MPLAEQIIGNCDGSQDEHRAGPETDAGHPKDLPQDLVHGQRGNTGQDRKSVV